jgi:hypothetical protein
MQQQNTGGLSIQELKKYSGFEKMNQNQLTRTKIKKK